MDWIKIIFFALIPLLICIYTINFGRWLMQKKFRFGGIATIGIGIAAFIVPVGVFLSKLQ